MEAGASCSGLGDEIVSRARVEESSEDDIAHGHLYLHSITDGHTRDGAKGEHWCGWLGVVGCRLLILELDTSNEEDAAADPVVTSGIRLIAIVAKA